MKTPLRRITFLVGALFASGTALAQELYIYPAKGQSAEQLDKDKYECYSWAKRDTGFDPMAIPTATTAAPSTEKRSGGVVRGGLGGAALGAIIGDSSKAAKRGAAAGGLIGGVRQSSQNSAAERERKEWEQREGSNYANNRNNYNRAYSACLEGRGYTVK
ncbi:hypothetical protein [Aestuariirhabdus sp. LZHN29]|uniref:hypothetical protein n=1 Tax=Aestuariirhabdus sp. LZHN29 TaxID=3417462 RepID=UPI003CF312CE